MKKAFIMMVFSAILSGLAFVSCGKDDSATNNNDGTEQPTPQPTPNPGQDTTQPHPTVAWVDMGLPSGLLWAECNLGAHAPEEYGDYYAWGEISPKEVYNWSTYRYCSVDGEGNLQTLNKYNTSNAYGSIDNLTTLEAMDDAATAALGSGAHIPTADEWRELIDNTTEEWTTMNGVNGRKFTATNGNTLFLPAAGRRGSAGLEYAGEHGFYWSSTLNTDDPRYARRFLFNADSTSLRTYCRRFNGPAVRAVRHN